MSSVFFNLKSLDGASDVEVQLVNPAYKTFQTPVTVDFNVNNLKAVRDGAHGRMASLAWT